MVVGETRSMETSKKTTEKTTTAKKTRAKKTTKKATPKKILVIVESPSKAKTISKYLGSRYKVVASVGHVRDLPKSRLGIEIENDFEPDYINIRGKGDVIRMLKKEVGNASSVLLATDPDREGEAISWHLSYLLGIPEDAPCRIEFNEITKNAVKEAIKHPRVLDKKLVDAQQARRVLDRLVGYQISPLLWRKVRRGLSAGRVQSAALKVICDREEEIKAFIPQEYWTISAQFKGQGRNGKFVAKLPDERAEAKRFQIPHEEACQKILADVENAPFTVTKLETKKTKGKTPSPFTTSSLQQDAAGRLGFSTRKTMQVAQQLYEGVTIKGKGLMGLVSYIRTDSVRISDEAREQAKKYILENFGPEYYGGAIYKNKKKDVQDAHEAIRPAYPELTPESVEDSLDKDQFKLYRLIWNRFMASQMTPAEAEIVQAVLTCGEHNFVARGRQVLFLGSQKVYAGQEEKDTLLPPLQEGDCFEAIKVEGEQHFTAPRPRFTEASLVKELEDKDIGRPSTYAPIVSTLQDRKYIKKESKSLVPTDLGMTVHAMMTEYFKDIVDVDFTAAMEDRLDDIESKEVEWKQLVRDFYGPFKKELDYADENIEKVVFEDTPTDEICETCGKPMVIKHGRFGEFIACSGFPECKNTRPLVKKIQVLCPDCGKDLVQRRSARGRIFYGCIGYPDCQRSYWKRPVEKACPQCGELLVEAKAGSNTLECSQKGCGYKEEKSLSEQEKSIPEAFL